MAWNHVAHRDGREDKQEAVRATDTAERLLLYLVQAERAMNAYGFVIINYCGKRSFLHGIRKQLCLWV